MTYRTVKVSTGSAWEPLAVAVTDARIWSVGSVTSTSYTLQLTDGSKFIKFNNSSPITVTVPADSSVAFVEGQELAFTQYGTGSVTIQGDTGVTIRSLNGNLEISGQYGVAKLVKLNSDEWLLSGDLTA